MRLVLDNVRIAFAQQLFKARKAKGSNIEKFGASFLIEKKSDMHKRALRVIMDAAKNRWGEKEGPAKVKELMGTRNFCLHDGDKKKYDGYAGNMYISASDEIQPSVRDSDGVTTLTLKDGRPYSGCYVRAIIEISAFTNDFGDFISAYLKGVQYWRKGDAFSGAAAASDDEFEAIQSTGEDGGDDEFSVESVDDLVDMDID